MSARILRRVLWLFELKKGGYFSIVLISKACDEATFIICYIFGQVK